MKWLVWPAVFLLAVFLEIYRELHGFRMTHYSIVSAKWPANAAEDKILFLSDLHNHSYGERNEKLLEAISGERPAAVFIGGDVPIAKVEKSFDDAACFVEDLCKICPVYYVNGNHEQRLKEGRERFKGTYERYRRRICDAGAILLENESSCFEVGEKKLRVTGLELPLDSYKKIRHSVVRVSDIVDRVGECAGEEYEILLAHNPEYADSYLAWGADLILCGHLHGGLVCLPNGRSLITPQFHLFPRYAAEMTRVGAQTVIVSRGLGTHTIHVRLFNPAEVVVLHLKGG